MLTIERANGKLGQKKLANAMKFRKNRIQKCTSILIKLKLSAAVCTETTTTGHYNKTEAATCLGQLHQQQPKMKRAQNFKKFEVEAFPALLK